MNKRGQFYLIAAVIFIAVILGFASLVNKISKQEVNFLIDIAKELDIESEKVYDYIIYNEMTTLQRNAQLLQFTEDFSTELSKLYSAIKTNGKSIDSRLNI